MFSDSTHKARFFKVVFSTLVTLSVLSSLEQSAHSCNLFATSEDHRSSNPKFVWGSPEFDLAFVYEWVGKQIEYFRPRVFFDINFEERVWNRVGTIFSDRPHERLLPGDLKNYLISVIRTAFIRSISDRYRHQRNQTTTLYIDDLHIDPPAKDDTVSEVTAREFLKLEREIGDPVLDAIIAEKDFFTLGIPKWDGDQLRLLLLQRVGSALRGDPSVVSLKRIARESGISEQEATSLYQNVLTEIGKLKNDIDTAMKIADRVVGQFASQRTAQIEWLKKEEEKMQNEFKELIWDRLFYDSGYQEGPMLTWRDFGALFGIADMTVLKLYKDFKVRLRQSLIFYGITPERIPLETLDPPRRDPSRGRRVFHGRNSL